MCLLTEITLGEVLIVDDEDDIREVLTVALEWVGHVVRSARTRDEAWRQTLHRVPHVILMDLHMPGMGVQEFVRRVQTLKPRPNIIVISADGAAQFIAHKLKLKNWIQKPFSIEALENTVSSCVAEHRN